MSLLAPHSPPALLLAQDHRRFTRAAGQVDRRMACFLSFTSFACLLPYPALNVGNSSALQMGNLLSLLLCLPIILVAGSTAPIREYLIILAPLCLSACKVILFNAPGDDLDLCAKSIVVWAISGCTLICSLRYVPIYGLSMLTGIAVAMLLHAAIGLLQLISFSSDEMPLVWLYVNRSFLSVQDNANTISRYIQRPFGLFPEPSAMSSSLAPWVLIFVALLTGMLRLPQGLTRGHRVLFSAAAIGGLGLIIISRSGLAAALLVGLIPLFFIWFIRARANGATFALLTVGVLVALPLIIWSSSNAIGDRLGGRSSLGNSSWEDRAQSLQIGFALMGDAGLSTVALGMGTGLSAPTIEAFANLEAVWSILLTYIYETGLLGALAMAWVLMRLVVQWRCTRFEVTYAAVCFVWLVGITLTTSYSQLLSPWMTLGWLLGWPLTSRRIGTEAQS